MCLVKCAHKTNTDAVRVFTLQNTCSYAEFRLLIALEFEQIKAETLQQHFSVDYFPSRESTDTIPIKDEESFREFMDSAMSRTTLYVPIVVE